MNWTGSIDSSFDDMSCTNLGISEKVLRAASGGWFVIDKQDMLLSRAQRHCYIYQVGLLRSTCRRGSNDDLPGFLIHLRKMSPIRVDQ